MGDTTGWQVVPSGYRIFLKPIEENATTNMTLITDKRTYFFELYGEHATSIDDPKMVFNVKFLYNDVDEEDLSTNLLNQHEQNEVPDLSNPENFNFDYSISGDEEIAPIKIFDNGEFTYLQFRKVNSEIPATFAVDDKRNESLVNSKIDQKTNTVIIEHVFKKLSLRLNEKILCIFNENYYQ
ncbi:MAG TPA: TrbG/VirB9 family P-type conjugative transfer protein [Candidatus Megaira endosymbiont of Hartmannula sinica]|nr:TrbG/VirB9 family P-type conjugative transfer protein [Candidatus Megaera endosymbiont of Hartmannula sinica]